jgi:hypothetical protein
MVNENKCVSKLFQSCLVDKNLTYLQVEKLYSEHFTLSCPSKFILSFNSSVLKFSTSSIRIRRCDFIETCIVCKTCNFHPISKCVYQSKMENQNFDFLKFNVIFSLIAIIYPDHG